MQSVAPDDVCHVLDHLIMLLPLLQKHLFDLCLRLCVDDVDDHRLGLQKSVDAMDGLYEIVELIVDAQEDGAVAMALEVAALAADGLLGGQQPGLAVRKVYDVFLPHVVVLRAVDLHRLRHGLLDGVALGFQVVPQYEVRLGVRTDDLQHLGHPVVDGFPLLSRGVLEPEGGVPEHLVLSVFVRPRGGIVHRQAMPAHVHLRQIIAGIVIAQVGGL